MKEMIAAIKNSDETAFRDCFFAFQKKLLGYYLKKSVVAEDAHDLVQTVFMKLWQYRRSLNEAYQVDQHIFQIARTVYIDYLRLQNKAQALISAETIPLPNTSSDPSTDYDMRQKLQLALNRMPAMRKKVFELHRMEGYSYLEIAGMFSISVKSVDNHVTRAVRQLREIFGSLMLVFLLMF